MGAPPCPDPTGRRESHSDPLPCSKPQGKESPEGQEEGEQECTMGMLSIKRDPWGQVTHFPQLSAGRQRCVHPPGQDFNLFSQEKGVGIMRGGCWSQARAHKASRAVWQETKVTRDLVLAMGISAHGVFHSHLGISMGEKEPPRLSIMLRRFPCHLLASSPLHVPTKVFCSSRPCFPIPRTIQLFLPLQLGLNISGPFEPFPGH